ncbi:MAG: hypothetical protein ACE5EG_01025 [Thermoanaerobaculia bacterium]
MRSPAALLLLAALTTPVAADTVFLVNGNKFEQVVAEREPGAVRMRMPYGEIVLPERVVARVERSRSIWQVFAERQTELRDAAASAPEWLELALWADAAGYPEGMREALLGAAEIDPLLDGLAPLMRRIGYQLDREAGQWLTEGDYMRQRGYRRWGDRWLTRDEYAVRWRAREEAQKKRRAEAREERITRAIEALVVAELSRAAEPEPPPRPIATHGPLVAVYPGAFFPFVAPAASVPAVGGPEQATFEELAKRQPGSLFPVRPRRHLTSSE